MLARTGVAVFCNPELLALEPVPDENADVEWGPELGLEECISIPKVEAEVPRELAVWCRATDLRGQRLEFYCSNFAARVLQVRVSLFP
jgi:peptide deformylase